MIRKNIQLVSIDPQNDFCHPNGSLFVDGAQEDMRRLAKMVARIGHKLTDIHVTMDLHHYVDVGHPALWVDAKGNHPTPVAQLTYDPATDKFINVIDGVEYEPFAPAMVVRMVNGKPVTLQEDMIDYATKLATSNKAGKYDTSLTIWPPHCLIGSWGSNIYDELFKVLLDWENSPAQVHYVTKGTNYLREHYSAIKAQVSDPTDPLTLPNTDFITMLNEADEIPITGEALNYCMANTFFDIVDLGGDEIAAKLVLIEDATSSVRHPIPEVDKLMVQYRDNFINEMTAKGMKVSNTQDYLA